MRKKLSRILIGIISFAIMLVINPCQFSKVVQAAEKDGEITLKDGALGYKEPTKEELEWFEDNKDKNEGNTRKSKAITILGNEVDNSTKEWFPPIGNQEELGSCVSFATTYYQMTYMLAKENNWNVKENSNSKIRSPKWTYCFANNGQNKGSTQVGNFKAMMEFGVPSLEEYPYVGKVADPINYREWPNNLALSREAIKYRIKSFGEIKYNLTNPKTPITSNKDEDLNEIKIKLQEGYLLTYHCYWYGQTFREIKSTNKEGVNNNYVKEIAISEPHHKMNDKSGHILTIVGYDDNVWIDVNGNNVAEDEELGAFKIANSWGADWGNKGFVWLSYDVLNTVSNVPGMEADTTRASGMGYVYYIDVEDIGQPERTVEFTLKGEDRRNMSILYNADASKDTSKNFYKNSASYSYPEEQIPMGGEKGKDEATFVVDLKSVFEDSRYNGSIHDYVGISVYKSNPSNSKVEVNNTKLKDSQGREIAVEDKEYSQNRESANWKSNLFKYKAGQLRIPTIKADQYTIKDNGDYTIAIDGTQGDGRGVYYDLYEDNKIIQSNRNGKMINAVEYCFVNDKMDGEYNYKVVIEDEKGNTATSENLKVVVCNLKKPTIEIDELSEKNDGEYYLNFGSELAGIYSANYELYENDVKIKSGETKGFFKVKEYFKDKKPGTYNYKVVLKDAKGNVATSDIFKVVVNPLNKPKMSLRYTFQEKDGNYQIELNGNQKDSTEVDYQIYENNIGVYWGKIKGNEYKSFNFYNKKDGNYEYKVKLVDGSGNESVSDIMKVVVDIGVGNISKPRLKTDRILSTDGRVSFIGLYGDLDHKTTKVEIYRDSQLVYIKPGGFDTPTEGSENGLKDGIYNYKGVFTDKNGKIHETDTVTIIVDRTIGELNKPVVSGSKDISSNGSYSIKMDWTNFNSDMLAYEVFENGVKVRAATRPGGPVVISEFDKKPEGIYEYQVVFYGKDDTKVISDKVKVIVDYKAIEQWVTNKDYKIGDKVMYMNKEYECTYNHKSQEGWIPTEAAALWKEVK